MMRLPQFDYLVPRTLSDALLMKTDAGPGGMFWKLSDAPAASEPIAPLLRRKARRSIWIDM